MHRKASEIEIYQNDINMNTNRRDFIKKAAFTAPAVALGGASHELSGTGSLKTDEQPVTYRAGDNGWLNVRDCGASGSTFQTTASTNSGSRQITVADVGDFKVGQGVMVSKCNIRYERIQMWGTGERYRNSKPVNNSVEIRGYDGSAGNWMIYVIDIAPSSSPGFRWTDDLSHTWHPEVPITHDWQPLSGGIEIRLNQRDWESGYVIAFGARDQLISRIEKIEGNILTLQDEANRSVNDAVVRHNDTLALQEAFDRAIMEKLNIFIPIGHYMLARTIRVKDAHAVTIEGSSSVDCILDISEGEGSCLTLQEGTEVIIRNFRMLGFMGFGERDKAGELRTRGSTAIWGFALKHCNGISINNTERVLVENCHASRMSGECFVSGGRSRGAVKPGQSFTQWITYRRCSVTDCARNAFNDTQCSIENTSVLNCRIIDVGGNSWESASRFVKFISNYMRNAGGVEVGNLGPVNRDNTYPDLGAGQHIIADNVFESNIAYGGSAIQSSRGATQVIIRNNLFINFNSSAILVSGTYLTNEYVSANTTIIGNIIDMTCIGQKSVRRTGISVNCNDTIVSDNQIYVRGTADPMVTAIQLREPALNAIVHDNLVRNCGTGIISGRGEARVGEVVDNRTFTRMDGPTGLPLEKIRPETVKGWTLIWRSGDKGQSVTGISVIESFNPVNLHFVLLEPHTMKKGDRLEVMIPFMNWYIHENLITDCLRPVVLDSYGSRTSILKDNLIARGNTTGVLNGVEVHGSFQLFDNRITGFDEDKSVSLALFPDAIGKVCKCQYKGNIFEKCSVVVTESQAGLWKNSFTKNNQVIECTGKLPK
jgi:hypothetical protein